MNSGLRTLKMQFLYRHEPLGNAVSILFALLALPGSLKTGGRSVFPTPAKHLKAVYPPQRMLTLTPIFTP